jgi:DNA mismatch repair ATPase MutS
MEVLYEWSTGALKMIGDEEPDGSQIVCAGVDKELDMLRDPSTASTAIKVSMCFLLKNEKSVPTKYAEQVSISIREGKLDALYAGQRAGNTRWSVKELRELGKRLADTEMLVMNRINVLLANLREGLIVHHGVVLETLQGLWEVDLSCGAAVCASNVGLTIVDVCGLTESETPVLDLKGVFHPVLRHLLRQVIFCF